MMGTVQQAAQVANALGAVSPKFAADSKIHSLRFIWRCNWSSWLHGWRYICA